MAQRKRFGFVPVVLGSLLALWLCLAPSAARAGTIGFNQAEASSSSTYPLPTLYWSAAVNWLPNAPANGDSVDLNLTSSQTVAQMNFDAGALSLSNLAVGAVGQGFVTLTLPTGTNLTSGSETIGTNGFVVQNGGSNTVTGALTLAANSSGLGVEGYIVEGGQLGAAAIVNNSGADLQFRNGGTGSYQTLTNEGTFIVDGAYTSYSLVTLNNPIGATLTNQNGGRMFIYAGSFGGNTLPLTFNNSGTGTSLLNLSGSTLTNSYSTLHNLHGATLTNDGTGTSMLNVGQGCSAPGCTDLGLTNDGTGTHLFNQNGATLTNDNVFLNNQNGATLTNTGVDTTLQNQNYGQLRNFSTLENLAGATLNNTAATLGNFTGGTIANDGLGTTLQNQNRATLYNMTDGSAATHLSNQNGATVTNDNSTLNNGEAGYGQGATITNTGTSTNFWNQNGGYLNNAGVGTNFYNQGGATLTNDNTTNAQSGTFIKNEAGATFTNSGPSTNLFNQNRAQLSNDGGGTSFFNQNRATIANRSGAALSNQNAATFTNEGGTVLNQTGGLLVNTGAGTTFLNQSGATLTNDGGGLANTTFFVNELGATLTNDASALNNIEAGAITNDASIIDNTNGATLTNTDAGTVFVNRNGATLMNGATSTVNNVNGALLSNESGSILANYGTLHNDGTLNNSATVDDYGTIDTPSGSGIYNQFGGSTIVEASGAFTQDTLNISGGGTFTDYGTVLIAGDANNSGTVTIDGASAIMTVVGNYAQLATTAVTNLNGGTLDPPTIDIEGGTFGGAGTVVADTVTLNGSTLQVGNAAGDQLRISTGAYSQTGGEIVFDIGPDGHGGFEESTLEFEPGTNIDIGSANILFDFVGGANPSAFSADGLFNIDTFFTLSHGSDFWGHYGGIFTGSGDSFALEGTNLPPTAVSFDSTTGNLGYGNSSTPEPGTLFLLLPGLGVLGLMTYRRSRNG